MLLTLLRVAFVLLVSFYSSFMVLAFYFVLVLFAFYFGQTYHHQTHNFINGDHRVISLRYLISSQSMGIQF